MNQSQQTTSTPARQVERKWRLINARNQVLGRLASQIAVLLQGKHKLYFTPNLDCGDFVVVTNAKEVWVTGKKRTDKVYRRHSGFPGGYREEPFVKLSNRRPTEIIRKAVWGMMPKNRLGRQMMKKLRVYEGEEHPHLDKLPAQKVSSN